MRQGVSDYISALYIIQKGRAHVENITEDVNVIIVKQLVENDVFGELALIFGSVRNASVRTLNFCETLSLHREHYISALDNFPILKASIRKRAARTLWKRMIQRKLAWALLRLQTVLMIKALKRSSFAIQDEIAELLQKLREAHGREIESLKSEVAGLKANVNKLAAENSRLSYSAKVSNLSMKVSTEMKR